MLVEPRPSLLGVCVVDAASGHCALGALLEEGGGSGRPGLNMTLLRYQPAEVVAARDGLSAATLAAVNGYIAKARGGGGGSSSSGVGAAAVTLLPRGAACAGVAAVGQLLEAQLPGDKLQQLQQLLAAVGVAAAAAPPAGQAPAALQVRELTAQAAARMHASSLAGFPSIHLYAHAPLSPCRLWLWL